MAAQACQRLQNELKESYFRDALEESHGDIRKTWRVIKQFWPYKRKTSNITSIDGETTDLGKAMKINEFFTNIAQNLDRDMPVAHEDDKLPPFPAHAPVLEFMPISKYDVCTLIRDAKSSSSCGVDGLTMNLIKYVVHRVLSLSAISSTVVLSSALFLLAGKWPP